VKRKDFEAFAAAVRRVFPKRRISTKLLKTIWRNPQLRALFCNVILARIFSNPARKTKTKTKTKKKKTTKKAKKRAKRKSKSKGKGKWVSWTVKKGPNKGKRVRFFAKR